MGSGTLRYRLGAHGRSQARGRTPRLHQMSVSLRRSVVNIFSMGPRAHAAMCVVLRLDLDIGTLGFVTFMYTALVLPASTLPERIRLKPFV